jgi:hypothetical protein
MTNVEENGSPARASEQLTVENAQITTPDGSIFSSPDHPIPLRQRSVSIRNPQPAIGNCQSSIVNGQS